MVVVEDSVLICFPPPHPANPSPHHYDIHARRRRVSFVLSEMRPDRIKKAKRFLGGFSQLITRARTMAEVNVRQESRAAGITWGFHDTQQRPQTGGRRAGERCGQDKGEEEKSDIQRAGEDVFSFISQTK